MGKRENFNKNKRKERIILTNIRDENSLKNNLLYFLSAQLSDGYWENEKGFFEEFWNWLRFDVKKDNLVIKVKNNPTWEDVKDIFSDKTDNEVVHYIGEVLDYCYDESPFLFERFGYGEEIKEIINELKNYSDNVGYENSSKNIFKEGDIVYVSNPDTKYEEEFGKRYHKSFFGKVKEISKHGDEVCVMVEFPSTPKGCAMEWCYHENELALANSLNNLTLEEFCKKFCVSIFAEYL